MRTNQMKLFYIYVEGVQLIIGSNQIWDDPLRVEMAYEFFADTVKGDALDNWLEIL